MNDDSFLKLTPRVFLLWPLLDTFGHDEQIMEEVLRFFIGD
jgi:hypothetical protein